MSAYRAAEALTSADQPEEALQILTNAVAKLVETGILQTTKRPFIVCSIRTLRDSSITR